MKINKNLLQQLMVDVEQGVNKLLSLITDQNNEIGRLKYQNEQLQGNYLKILQQVDGYVNELEEIKTRLSKK